MKAVETNPQKTSHNAAVVKLIVDQVIPLLNSGTNWKVTLHGGGGGGVKCEVQKFVQIIPEKTVKLRK